VLLGFGAFFSSLLVFFVSPFALNLASPGQPRARALDPLLRNPSIDDPSHSPEAHLAHAFPPHEYSFYSG